MVLTPAKIRVFKSNQKDNDVVRYLIEEAGIVVKMFDNDQGEFYSVKVWKGDVERVLSHWNMVETNDVVNFDVVEDLIGILTDSVQVLAEVVQG